MADKTLDLLRLEKPSYIADMIIQGYNSIVWTERFQDPGEFELRTSEIARHKTELPEGTLISHRNTGEVMIVEAHEIAVDENGIPELVIKGRSAIVMLEARTVKAPHGKKYRLGGTYIYHPDAAAQLMMWNWLVNTTTIDATRDTQGDYTKSPLDAIPNALISETKWRYVGGGEKRRWVTEGPVYPQVMDLLRSGEAGLRTQRPGMSDTLDTVILTARTVSATRGYVDYEVVDADSHGKLEFNVLTGSVRTKENVPQDPGYQPVLFNYDGGHVDDPKYLWSIKDYATVAEVTSARGRRTIHRDNTQKLYSGWDRKVYSFDAGEPDTGETNTEFRDDLPDFGKEQLRTKRITRIFEGAVSQTSRYEYRTHYSLGDLVTLQGQYGFDQTMMVTEHTTIWDRDGFRSYPGLLNMEEQDQTQT
jgi:hypothetical protein